MGIRTLPTNFQAVVALALLGPLLFMFMSTGCGDDGPGTEPDAPVNPMGDASPGDGPPPLDCDVAAQALAAELYQSPQACSVVVRMDYQTRALVAYQVVCGPYMGTDEAQARATAQADTGYGATGTMLNNASPEDAYVFFQAAGDFGGSAVVSARSALSLFGGSTVWDGAGDITYPAEWRPASELGAMCPPAGGIALAHGYDLATGQALDATDVDAAVAVVAQTAVPDGFWRGGYVFDALVLLYPRSVGVFDPASAEWVVVVNGGWLE